MRRLLIFAAAALTGCGDRVEQFVRPDQVADFKTLYEGNCSGCHGTEGRQGAARPLNDPVFLALIDRQTILDTIAQGRRATAMPGGTKKSLPPRIFCRRKLRLNQFADSISSGSMLILVVTARA